MSIRNNRRLVLFTRSPWRMSVLSRGSAESILTYRVRDSKGPCGELGLTALGSHGGTSHISAQRPAGHYETRQGAVRTRGNEPATCVTAWRSRREALESCAPARKLSSGLGRSGNVPSAGAARPTSLARWQPVWPSPATRLAIQAARAAADVPSSGSVAAAFKGRQWRVLPGGRPRSALANAEGPQRVGQRRSGVRSRRRKPDPQVERPYTRRPWPTAAV